MNRKSLLKNEVLISILISIIIAFVSFIIVIIDRICYGTAFEDNSILWMTMWANIILAEIRIRSFHD